MTVEAFCPTCGQARAEGVRFCGNCGREYSAARLEKPPTPSPLAKARFSGMQIFLFIVALLIAGVVFGPKDGRTGSTNLSPAGQLQADYGGDTATYNRIFAISDCSALLREHDIALENEAREVKGTSAASVAHGYGRAAAQRMIQLDC